MPTRPTRSACCWPGATFGANDRRLEQVPPGWTPLSCPGSEIRLTTGPSRAAGCVLARRPPIPSGGLTHLRPRSPAKPTRGEGGAGPRRRCRAGGALPVCRSGEAMVGSANPPLPHAQTGMAFVRGGPPAGCPARGQPRAAPAPPHPGPWWRALCAPTRDGRRPGLSAPATPGDPAGSADYRAAGGSRPTAPIAWGGVLS